MKRFFKDFPTNFMYGILCGIVAAVVILLSWRIIIPLAGVLLIIYIINCVLKANHK